jgi:hypothetical protein
MRLGLKDVIHLAQIPANDEITPDILFPIGAAPAPTVPTLYFKVGISMAEAQRRLTLATLESYYGGDKKMAATGLSPLRLEDLHLNEVDPLVGGVPEHVHPDVADPLDGEPEVVPLGTGRGRVLPAVDDGLPGLAVIGDLHGVPVGAAPIPVGEDPDPVHPEHLLQVHFVASVQESRPSSSFPSTIYPCEHP